MAAVALIEMTAIDPMDAAGGAQSRAFSRVLGSLPWGIMALTMNELRSLATFPKFFLGKL